MQLETLLNVFSLFTSIPYFFLNCHYSSCRAGFWPWRWETLLLRGKSAISFHPDPRSSIKWMENWCCCLPAGEVEAVWRQVPRQCFGGARSCHWCRALAGTCLGVSREGSRRLQGVQSCWLESVGPPDKDWNSGVVFPIDKRISTNVTAATELWELDLANK